MNSQLIFEVVFGLISPSVIKDVITIASNRGVDTDEGMQVKLSRRVFLALGVVASSLAITGCASLAGLDIEYEEYEEEVASILMTEDSKRLIIMTAKYHYIFELEPIFINTLKSSFAKRATIQFYRFYVDELGEITGEVWVYLNANASEVDKKEAIKAGYSHEKYMAVQANIKIKGNRYLSNKIVMPPLSKNLSRSYKIPIKAVVPSGDVDKKSLVSPISVAGDGLFLLGLTVAKGVDFGVDVFVKILKN